MINLKNALEMKLKVSLLVGLMLLGFTTKSIAQMDDCAVTLSLFVEPAKAKNYEAALAHYDKIIEECPKYSIAIYQYGEKMFEHFIEKGDKSKIEAYKKNLEMRLTHFPSKTKKGDVYSKLALLKYENGIGTKADQFAQFNKAFTEDEANFNSPKRLYTYFSLAVDLYNEGQKEIQYIFELYDGVKAKIEKEEVKLASKLTKLIDKEEAGTALSSKEKKYAGRYEKNLTAYGQVKGSVDGKLGILADCPNLIPLYEKDFEDKKNDIKWLKSAAGRLNDKECETPLFFQLVQQLHELEPSAKSAFYLGRLASKENNMSVAIDYYKQAAELETDDNDKAKVYYTLAEAYKDKGSYSTARSYYNKALGVKPSLGVCYLKIAQMYAKSTNNCGNTVFEKRAVYWKAAEMADKAARVDASIASNARKAAASYRGLAPSKSDIFSEGMAGKSITFSCWIGGSVRVPNLK